MNQNKIDEMLQSAKRDMESPQTKLLLPRSWVKQHSYIVIFPEQEPLIPTLQYSWQGRLQESAKSEHAETEK